MMFSKSLAHLITSALLLHVLPQCLAQHQPLASVRDAGPSYHRRLSKDKEMEYTSYPTKTYASYPTGTPTRYPTTKPSSPPPVPSPTAQPATSFPTDPSFVLSPPTTAIAPIESPFLPESTGSIPLFDNNVTATRVMLKEFDITIESDVDGLFDPDAVADIYKREVRQSLQQYLHRNLGLSNILLVQLREVPSKRRSLAQIQETFRYGGRVDFRETAPSEAELHERQAAIMAHASDVQVFLNSENEYLQDINVTDVQIISAETRPAPTKPDDDNISFIVIIAVASGVALAISLLLCVLVCRFFRPPPPPPLPSSTKKTRKVASGGGAKMDTSVTSTSSAEHLQLALSESTAAVTVVTEPEKPGRGRLFPAIEKKDSEDSMDGFSLGSGGMYGRSKQVKPSWMRPLKRSSPVPEYNSDNESQFSYEQVAGRTEETSALGPTLSSDFESDADEELAIPSSPMVTKGYVPTDTPDKTLESISPMPSRYTKGLDMGDEETPFDETMEDSMEQDFDAFHVELAKFNHKMIPGGAEDATTRG